MNGNNVETMKSYKMRDKRITEDDETKATLYIANFWWMDEMEN